MIFEMQGGWSLKERFSEREGTSGDGTSGNGRERRQKRRHLSLGT